jgi:hypothetical protein
MKIFVVSESFLVGMYSPLDLDLCLDCPFGKEGAIRYWLSERKEEGQRLAIICERRDCDVWGNNKISASVKIDEIYE